MNYSVNLSGFCFSFHFFDIRQLSDSSRVDAISRDSISFMIQ